jgi:hypothetical protein
MRARTAPRRCAAFVVVIACANHAIPAAPQRKPQGSAEARTYYYADDQGLTVITAAARAEQEVTPNLAISAQAVLDHINIERGIDVHADTGGQPTGHVHDVDAVTSASVTVLGGDSLVKNRVEGSAAAALTGEVWDVPMRLEPSARVSIESDYHSYSGRLQATAELFERNTTLSGFVGYGHDQLDPTEDPPGESKLWPASHDRVSAGALLSQLLSRRILVSGGFAVNQQFGRLSNPYRRALIRTSLFPERLPDSRTRVTAFASVACYLGFGTALHLRSGAYADSWDVLAFMPQAALAVELSDSLLATLQYRYYRQTAASFYELRYETLQSTRTGDARLGRIEEHQAGAEVSWNFLGRPGSAGSLLATGGYRLSLPTYLELDRGVIAHIGLLALGAAY